MKTIRQYFIKQARQFLVRLLRNSELLHDLERRTKNLENRIKNLEDKIAEFKNLEKYVFEARSLESLKVLMGWQHDPIINEEHLYPSPPLLNLNFRPLRDAEVLGTVCRNTESKIILEIGTQYGHGASIMADNAPGAQIYTVNMLPEDKEEAGTFITKSPSREEIGRHYRQHGYKNIEQIYANTLYWEPDFGPIDVAFIDGSHDADFVYNDTRKILEHCRPGSIILWHDFAPGLVKKRDWIHDVCTGVERLYRTRLISGPILWLVDSWMGLYVVTEADINRINIDKTPPVS